jgi:hypothetical protein
VLNSLVSNRRAKRISENGPLVLYVKHVQAATRLAISNAAQQTTGKIAFRREIGKPCRSESARIADPWNGMTRVDDVI